MARLNIERQQRLEPTRIEYAVKRIEELGYEVIHKDSQMIKFITRNTRCSFIRTADGQRERRYRTDVDYRNF